VEINGLRIGFCEDINIDRNLLHISRFVERDDYKQLHRLEDKCHLTIVSYSSDGEVIRVYDFHNATCVKKWMGNLEISFTKKTARSVG
jgi:hypothetical protein